MYLFVLSDLILYESSNLVIILAWFHIFPLNFTWISILMHSVPWHSVIHKFEQFSIYFYLLVSFFFVCVFSYVWYFLVLILHEICNYLSYHGSFIWCLIPELRIFSWLLNTAVIWISLNTSSDYLVEILKLDSFYSVTFCMIRRQSQTLPGI